MSKRHPTDERARMSQEDYFRRKDAELLEDLKRREAAEKERAEMKKATGIADDRIVEELQRDGFDRETVALLHLVPLIEVAWADGAVSPQEKTHIVEAARLHGVAPDSRAHDTLAGWLETKPADEFFRGSRRGIRAILDAAPAEQQAGRPDLLELCTRVASASGGFFGLGSKISPEEKALLAEIAAELAQTNKDAVEREAAGLRGE